MKIRLTRLALVAVPAILAGHVVGALETDQYYAWGRTLPDASEVVNAKLNLELERALASFDAAHPPENCRDIAVRLRKRLRFILFHHIQMWALKTSLVPKVPEGVDEELRFRAVNMYHDHGPFDIGMWMPIVPTIEMDGVRFGTDKLAHFFSSGWNMFRIYNRARRRGSEPAEAELAALRRGILDERMILGGMTSGLVSLADLEAGHMGMRFWRDLCECENPVIVKEDGRWILRRRIDLRDYVSPEWDESYQPSVYRKWRWRKVERVVEQYCDRLSDPRVVAMRRRYRERDRVTLVEKLIGDMVSDGRLPDPWQFTIEAVCGEPLRASWGIPALPAPRESPRRPLADSGALTREILARENDQRDHRVGLTSIGLSDPGGVSASFGIILSRLPAEYECHSTCNLTGPFVQVEPGVGAGGLSLGYGRVIGELGRNEHFLSKVFLAMGIKAKVLRTWGSTSRVHPNQTYFGPEIEFSVAKVNFGLGYLRRVDGTAGDRWLLTSGIGWGF